MSPPDKAARQNGARRGRTVGALLISACLAPAWGNSERLYFDCPCRVAGDGETLTVTVGARSFRTTDSGPVEISVTTRALDGTYGASIGPVQLAESVAAESRLASSAVEIALETARTGSWTIELSLTERIGEASRWQDRIRMASPVDLAGPFDVGELDYLADTDGDGVGDVNERAEQTDPDDPASTPGASTIDVLALYSQGFPDLYGGDATTRIQHLTTLANVIIADSGLAMELRLVGTVLVEVDEQDHWARPDAARIAEEVSRHGSDLTVLYRPQAPNAGSCGWSYLGGLQHRGVLSKEEAMRGISTVMGNCSGRTLAHELGHALGLGHSFWQNSTGTWRWSRGHGVDEDFGTVMTYGPKGGGPRLEVFSDPDASCRGRDEVDRPCGEDRDAEAGADAVASLDAVRFQAAAFQDGYPDSDGDGFVDPVDDLPEDATEWHDTDGDGVGNNADTDDDGDGVADGDDVFPLDSAEWADADGDGVGDNGDAFPDDAAEWADADGDGVGDNGDAFPDDAAEWADSDGDGVGDNGDPFPDDPTEWADTDADGVGDNADPDADGDGVANETDLFPLDAAKSDIASYAFVYEGPGGSSRGGVMFAAGGEDAHLVVGAPLYDSERGAVYLVRVADLAALDAIDGTVDREVDLGNVAAGANSWKFVGESGHAGSSAVAPGDMDGDGVADIVIGAPWLTTGRDVYAGAVYFASGADLAAADAADGVADGTVSLAHIAARPRSWKIVGDRCATLGVGIAAADLDGDGEVELLIGAPSWCYYSEEPDPGAAYVVSLGDLAAADAADGDANGVVRIANAVQQPGAYRLIGETGRDQAGSALGTVGDLDGDGQIDFGIGAPHAMVGEHRWAGKAYLVSTGGMAAADAADGEADGDIALAGIAAQPGSWRITGDRVWSSVGRRFGSTGTSAAVGSLGTTYLLAAGDLAGIDAADGAVDGTIAVTEIAQGPNSWTLQGVKGVDFPGDVTGDGHEDIFSDTAGATLFPAHLLPELDEADGSLDGQLNTWRIWQDERSWRLWATTPRRFHIYGAAGDVDGDGRGDLLLAESQPADGDLRDRAYLVSGADLAVLDRVDGSTDGDLRLGSVAGDTDADGLGNTLDPDDDNDGFPDGEDAFQLDPAEWLDTDRDLVGDNADAFPEDRNEQYDTDGDGIGDNADDDDDGDGLADSEDDYPLDTDNDGVDNRDDDDDDGDGVADTEDDLPIDPTESVDTDGDGVGNNADDDDDNDGVADDEDDLPLDPTESVDSDGDGTGDNADAFPNDPDEQADADGDGTGDNADTDDDNDGVPDTEDAFPLDPTASADTDADGVPDSRDAFPEDASESVDSDGDGVGDNADADDDNDGVADASDVFPLDPERWSLSSLRFVPQASADGLGFGLGAVGDLDGDGRSELLLGAPYHEDGGAVYVVSSADLASVDEGDGIRDGSVAIEHVAGQAHSWQLLGEAGLSTGIAVSSAGDFGGDSAPELVVGAGARIGAVYVVSPADLAGTDAADGNADGVAGLGAIATGVASWRLRGAWGGATGYSSALLPLGTDATPRVLLGQYGWRAGDGPGTAHLLSAGELAVLDGVDGTADGRLDLGRHEGAGLFTGEAALDQAAYDLAAADFDGDGSADVVIGAPGHEIDAANEGAVYVVGSRDFAGQGAFDLADVVGLDDSFKIVGEGADDKLGSGVAVADVDGDGHADLVLGTASGIGSRAVVHVLSGDRASLETLDLVDGTRDGLIDLAGVADRAGYWRLGGSVDWWQGNYPRGRVAVADVDGDGREDLLLPFMREGRGPTLPPDQRLFLLVSGQAVDFDADVAGTDIDSIVGTPVAYAFHGDVMAGNRSWSTGLAVANAGDVDGDGLEDILLGTTSAEHSAAYLVIAADLVPLDAADGAEDGVIDLANIVGPRL